MALNNFQIDYILKNNHITKKYFIGTFPACQFPDIRKRKYGFRRGFIQVYEGKMPVVISQSKFDGFIPSKDIGPPK